MGAMVRISKLTYFFAVILFSAAFIHAADAELKLNSNNGSTKFEVQDNSSQAVMSIDSSGNILLKGTATVQGNYFSVGGEILSINDQGVCVGTTTNEGLLHISNGFPSAGAPAGFPHGDADELVISNNQTAGISILTPDNNGGYLVFGSPSQRDVTVLNSFYNAGNEYLDFTIGNNPMVRFEDNGSVGIDTQEPTHKLHVAGGILATSSVTAQGFYDGDDASYYVDPSSNAVSANFNGSIVLAGTVDGVDLSEHANSKTVHHKPRAVYTLTDPRNNIASSGYMYMDTNTSMSGTYGLRMHRPGSVTGISVVMKASSYSAAGNTDFEARKNGAPLFQASVNVNNTGDVKGGLVQLPNIYTFAVGDILSIYITRTSGTYTVEYPIVILEVVFDD